MAQISVVRDGDRRRITLTGRLTALRRLERACGAALEHAPLAIDVEQVNSVDDVARGYLDRLRARGARIQGDLDAPHIGGVG